MVCPRYCTGDGTNPNLAFAFDSAGKPVVPVPGFGGTNFTQAARGTSSVALYGNGGNDVLYGDDAPGVESHLVGEAEAVNEQWREGA